MNKTATKTTATYKYRQTSRACDNFGAVDYTTTETITVDGDGLRVDARCVGVSEGERVDQRSSKFWPGVTLEAACAYRDRNGYTRVNR